MTHIAKKLAPLSPGTAYMAEGEIEMLSASAYADAALHDPSEEADQPQHYEEREAVDNALSNEDGKLDAMRDVMPFLSQNFDGSDRENLLNAAFANLTALVRTRASSDENGAEQDVRMGDAVDFREKISACVQAGDLPESCLKHYEDAHDIAIIAAPTKAWTSAEETRRKQGWQL